MGLVAPHDLLVLSDPADLVSRDPRPSWVAEALARALLVVVRRAPRVDGLIPVGVRGLSRSERHAALLPPAAIAERITPEQLAAERGWVERPRVDEIGALRALKAVETILGGFGFAWGPVGSVGFELASGAPTATPVSDLDLVIRAPHPLPLDSAKEALAALSTAPVHVDVQVETPGGAVALAEYASGSARMLLRTPEGPRMVAAPWGGILSTSEAP